MTTPSNPRWSELLLEARRRDRERPTADRLTLPPLSHTQFADDPWKPPDWIRSVGEVHGIEFHFDFFLIHLDDDDVQRAATPELDERLSLLRRACGARGPFETVEMEDAPYVLFMTPVCTP